MKIIDLIKNFEFTVSGGFAIYLLLCTIYITAVGVYEIFEYIFCWIQHIKFKRL